MGRGKLVVSPEARRDLGEIYDWILDDSGQRRAKAVITRLTRVMERLAEMPTMGRVRSEYRGAPYSFSVSPWLIFYERLPVVPGIEVLRVLDGRRDVDRLMGGDQ